jgi:carboxymethylenebutenolidase
MKHFLGIALLFTLFFNSKIAVAQSCCEKSGIDFQALALNKDFQASHLAPEPLSYAPQSGSMITFSTKDAKTGNAFYVPSDAPTDKVLIIFHEWWGLNDYIKREAERWQKELGNIDVYAVDLYDGKVAGDAAAAGKLSSGLDEKRGEYIVNGLLAHIGMDKLVGTLGWCMGGTWSLKAAIMAGNQAKACVMYYGFPKEDDEDIKKLQTDVLYIWASRDKHIGRNVVETLQKQVEGTGHKFSWYTFDADHAFANPSNPVYDKQSAAQAEELAISFLKEKMQIKKQ